MFTREEDIRRDLEITEKKPAQLLSIRWQAVGIVIALMSGIWGITVSSILRENLELGVIYLSIFLGILFSIVILFVWRYIHHLIGDEEAQYQQGIFFRRELLKLENLDSLSLEEFKKEEENIKNTKLKIYWLEHHLRNEIGDSTSEGKSIIANFNKLDDSKKILLHKKLNYIPFENGQWKFDRMTFVLIISSWIIGGYLLFLISSYNQISNNQFFMLFHDIASKYYILYVYFLIIGFFILRYFLKYLIPNGFIRLNSPCRIAKIRESIATL